jgi:hypothetical protein
MQSKFSLDISVAVYPPSHQLSNAEPVIMQPGIYISARDPILLIFPQIGICPYVYFLIVAM